MTSYMAHRYRQRDALALQFINERHGTDGTFPHLKEVASVLDVSMATASTALNRLQAAGLIKRGTQWCSGEVTRNQRRRWRKSREQK